MSDQSAGHAHRTPKAEFYVYFVLIFLVAVPLSLLAWAGSVLRHQRLPVHGPLARAWLEAKAITPAIFRP
ncbi:cytochrome PufQ [Pseudotabrizicola algicola]|uniref:Protein pufQ n=1 Tax=Pseudotabrizicola algicola TaxID=2709381 RepID=A0A6B3RNQ2_9RHOB|nr:cytochrome PufQ [Pseudotabrizicola algicola]NEX44709.1 protein pufQ [Pseudotabrizicola algicola]